jgi:hypothetical protein
MVSSCNRKQSGKKGFKCTLADISALKVKKMAPPLDGGLESLLNTR